MSREPLNFELFLMQTNKAKFTMQRYEAVVSIEVFVRELITCFETTLIVSV